MHPLQRKVLTYYKKNGRDLPWRKTTDPYKVLVSEIMLQQTQVDRVIPKYEAFLATLPDFTALATVDTHTLLQLWQGLGYNNRALRLRTLAQLVVENHNGVLPTTPEQLEQLPGIGKYTARSVLIFAHNAELVTVDTNIRRIFIAELQLPESITEKELYYHAEQLLPAGKSRDWHNALMDYGATLLTSRKTGIKPVSKQSTFKDSDRYYRGQILKSLLAESMTVRDTQKKYGLEKERLHKILTSMEKDNLIEIKEKTLRLRE